MSKITLIFIIFLMVIWLFYIVQQSDQRLTTQSDQSVPNNNIENITNVSPNPIISSGDIIINKKQTNKQHVVLSDQLTIPNNNTKHIRYMPSKKCIVKQKNNIISKSEINDGHEEICPKGPISIKQFNKEFFNFRDKTENNSSMVLDPVDKMTDLFLDGTIWNPPKDETRTIGAIYDELTKRPDFQSECTRLPTFDSVMFDGYMNFSNTTTGLYSNGNEWVYKDENENNGGKLENKLYAHDTGFNNQYPLSAFPPIEPTNWAGGVD